MKYLMQTESYMPPLATSCENMPSHRELIMEKTRKFQIVYEGLKNLCQHSTTDLARGTMRNECKRSALSKARSIKINIPKLQAAFLYSIYHQRAGKTNLVHIRGSLRSYLETIPSKSSTISWNVSLRWR